MDHNQFHMHNNWAQVIYGGETVGALAMLKRMTSPAQRWRKEFWDTRGPESPQ